jgi:hypothetical protein
VKRRQLTAAAALLIALAGLLTWPYAALGCNPGLTDPQLAAEFDANSCDAPDLAQAPLAGTPGYPATAFCWGITEQTKGCSNYSAAANGIRAPPTS